ncbi:MAG: aminotransferase class IV [Bacteroidales bacterium]|nr:aminotransferase class IV [Bacteroidales bacterium]
MSRFIETLHLNEGQFLNLFLHQERLRKTIEAYFPGMPVFDLETILKERHLPSAGKYRCTLTYSSQPEDFSIIPYKPRKINHLITKNGGNISYSFKLADRSELNRLLEGFEPDEEIIILKDGWVTDASYANLAFYSGGKWYTPSTPLLNGTKRQLLIRKGKILETVIQESDLKKFQKCSLINAMLDLGEVEIDCQNIR